jgi:hypothetical protein
VAESRKRKRETLYLLGAVVCAIIVVFIAVLVFTDEGPGAPVVIPVVMGILSLQAWRYECRSRQKNTQSNNSELSTKKTPE